MFFALCAARLALLRIILLLAPAMGLQVKRNLTFYITLVHVTLPLINKNCILSAHAE